MTQEDKELLFKDLCARLPYGVKCKIDLQGILDYFEEYRKKFVDARNLESNLFDIISNKDYILYGYPCPERVTLLNFEGLDDYGIPIEFVKPHLRPISSMTKEEKNELLKIYENHFPNHNLREMQSECIDFYNKYHFDYRGLIEKGLAIAVTEENNPYA